MRVASFFAGIGGFDLGFERAGMEVVFQCEIDKFCQKVLKKNFPGIQLHSDISTLVSDQIPEADIWCGGFPCQDLSLANQGKRKGLDGKRSGLFYQFAELASQARPKWLVLENVVGLLNANNGEDFRAVLATLDELGYCSSWRVLDSKYFGTPQRRRRTFIVASLGHIGSSRILFDDKAIAEMASQTRMPGAHAPGRLNASSADAAIYAIQHATIGRKATAGPQAKGFRNDGETYTLDSRSSSDVVCATNAGFRIRESSRISRELDSRRLKALGNAVNVDVANWLASQIIEVENLIQAEQGIPVSNGSENRRILGATG
jgi:DNA (cytosine-5)-methyltransferase 1